MTAAELVTTALHAGGDLLAAGGQIVQQSISDLTGTRKRVSWVFLLISATLAFCVFTVRHRRDGRRAPWTALRALTPASIYLHPSSVQDYLWFFLSPLLHVPLLAAIAVVSPVVSVSVFNGLVAIAGPSWRLVPHWGAQIGCAFAMLMAIDFGNYVSHWLMHRVTALWEFHKTHHSALVLNPFTADRLHPLERVLIELCVGVASGVTAGVIAFVYWPYVTIATLFGINVVALLTNIISGNLRHSHVWISYGRVLEHVFSSPAQHQVHHSRDPKHWDKNLSTHFALWDWLFGTLYVTGHTPEPLELGLADRTESRYRTPWALLAEPFKANWRRARGTPTA